MARKFEKNVDGVAVFFLGRSPEDFEVGDLVVDGRECCVGVYYMVRDYPRYRVAFSDDWAFDGSDSVVVYSELVEFAESTELVEAAYFLMAHRFEYERDFKAWELGAMSRPFMDAHGCGFIAEAAGEWAV